MDVSHDQNGSIEVSREQLYDQVWGTPINHLAEKFGVSGSYLARVCTALNVPRPPPGYWQKKAVGKDKPRPDLPSPRPGDQLTWKKDGALATPVVKDVRPRADARPRAKESAPVKASIRRHPMLRGVEDHFRKSRKTEVGEFLRPYKLLLPDIVTSEGSMIRAIGLAGRIYNALEDKGHRVLFAPPDEAMRRAKVDEREFPDPERIEIFDLALKKELLTAGPYEYGQKLTFNIRVCNQGNIGATNIDVRDYMAAGYSFSLADNPAWTAWPTYTITSIVQPNTCFDIPLVLEVIQTTGGEKDWINYAQITAADNRWSKP